MACGCYLADVNSECKPERNTNYDVFMKFSSDSTTSQFPFFDPGNNSTKHNPWF